MVSRCWLVCCEALSGFDVVEECGGLVLEHLLFGS